MTHRKIDRTDTDAVDPDSLTKTPKPLKDFEGDVGSEADRDKGKSSASNPKKTNEGDEDCQIIEVFDLLPISYAYPMSSTSADTGGQVTESSRGTKRTSDAPADEGLTRQCLQIVDLGFRGREGR